MFQLENIKKLTLFVNTVLMTYVILMTGLYKYYDVNYMVYHSIVTIILYIFFYYMIHKDWLTAYLWIVYAVIIVYMLAATICLGNGYGFHLYCLSLIPLIFYMEYLAYKLHAKKPKSLLISLAIIIIYLICTGYVSFKEPVYDINPTIGYICMAINAISVFFCLIFYTKLLISIILDSENKLSDMALKDGLTGLFNRHYMLSYLENLKQDISPKQWTAMVDIDNFKKINDTYGHNCGDYVLIQLCKIIQDVCKECVVSRWGGEEFLITANGNVQDQSILEKLRQAVASTPFSYQGKDFNVSITIGTSYLQPGQSLDSWIQAADDKLYHGKNNGKNQVIY